MYPDGAYQAAYKKAGRKGKRFFEVHEIHNVFASASRVRRNGAVRVYNDEVGFVCGRVYHALAYVEQFKPGDLCLYRKVYSEQKEDTVCGRNQAE